mmetsp:Transcript_6841/g.11266  ORF Transcript_6841/g.11266 Transcript_6841/m.11266 type:complete len:390 (-) Transcript_6841:57-1226(-)
MRPRRAVLFLLLTHAEACDRAVDACEADAFPLLQMSRQNASIPNSTVAMTTWATPMLHKSPALRALGHSAAPADPAPRHDSEEEDLKQKFVSQAAAAPRAEDSSLPFNSQTALPMNGTTPDGKIITRRMREKQLGREAVSAAALIMILISFSVGLQLIMVEFVMTGTCAIPRNIAGVFLAMILTITAGLRALVRFATAPLRPPCRLFWHCCCICCCWWRKNKGLARPAVTQSVPEPVMEQVAAFLSLDGMCELGCASRSCRDVVNSESCYEVLMNEVKSTGLEQRWERHVHHKVTMGESESSSSSADVSTPEVITDVVRYCMLVIGWFWFSAEVMDMACLEGGGPWQVIKAVSSPCLFIFILESDRNHFWWQVAAGLVAAVLLLDLLFS